jgi:DNA-binding phage protein
MALTRDFRETVMERVRREPAFGLALLREALELMYADDLETGRSVLRTYINATIGFPKLAKKTKLPSASLQRMFGPNGNPSAQNLMSVIAVLQKNAGVSIELHMRTKKITKKAA